MLNHLDTQSLTHLAASPLAMGTAPDVPWLRIVLVFLLCVGLAFVAVGFVRLRYGMEFLPARLANPIKAAPRSQRSDQRLEIIERLGAGPSSQFIVLARGEQKYLLHISAQGVTEIDRYQEAQEGREP